MSTEGAVIEIIKWIRESIRPIVVMLIVSALALFLPQSWLAKIGIVEWLQRFRPWMILLFVGSLVWLATFPIEHGYLTIRRPGRLKQLTPEEYGVLKYYIQN